MMRDERLNTEKLRHGFLLLIHPGQCVVFFCCFFVLASKHAKSEDFVSPLSSFHPDATLKLLGSKWKNLEDLCSVLDLS